MQESNTIIPTKRPRNFVSQDFQLNNWSGLKPYLENLQSRSLNSLNELLQWLKDRSELEAVLAEEVRWRYIRMTTDTENKDYSAAYRVFVQDIEPKATPFFNLLDKKLAACRFIHQLPEDEYFIYLRNVKNRLKIFREENILLIASLKVKANEFARISGKMTVEYKGKTLTLQQISNYLKSTDRSEREHIFHLISDRRLQDCDALNNLFDELIKDRNQLALNAGEANYRDYKFKDLGRFDYTVEDCFAFHHSIQKAFRPLADTISQRRKEVMGLDTYRPWDGAVDPFGRKALQPFSNTKTLIDKTISCFNKLDPFFAECLDILQEMGHLDLESRIGKAPGGYNSTLPEIGVPFIFMNASGSSRDVRTLLHEGGHAVHSFLMRNIPFVPNRNIPSEVAELASMSMELLSMKYWDTFYDNEKDLNRAKIEQLEGVVNIFPWIARIDKFQHWIYTHPQHTQNERRAYWLKLADAFGDQVVDWSGLENEKANSWQKQLHLFEVPFYYIEYGISQLGAIAIWKSYQEHPEETIRRYKEALSLGYTKPISKIYETAGIAFDFSENYIKSLVSFVENELKSLYRSA